MLPHFVWEDFLDVLADLRGAGYDFEPDWFEAQREFRFPVLRPCRARRRDARSCARRSSPGTCWARRARPAARCATSIPRSSACRCKVEGLTPGRHVVTCNGRRVPMAATGTPGEAVAGVRFKAWQPPSGLHPTIPVHAPLTFDILDTLERPLARRLRLSRRPSGRAQLRHLPGQFLRGRGAAPGALPGSRPHAGQCRRRRRGGDRRVPADARSADAGHRP